MTRWQGGLLAGVSLLVVMLFVQSASAYQFSSTSYRIDASVGNNFGGQTGSSSYKLVGSGGESIVGNGSGGSYKVGMGYVSQLEKSFSMTVQPSGLVAYYPLDEGGGKTVYDQSIHTGSGSLQGTATWYPGKIGSSVDMNSGGHVLVPYSSALPSGSAMTIELWVYRAGLVTNNALISQWVYSGGGAQNGAWALQTANDTGTKLRFFLVHDSNDFGNNYVDTPAGSFPESFDGSWHHVAVVYDGTKPANARVAIYIDGMPQSTTVTGEIDSSINPNTANLAIGEFVGLNRQFSGGIDHVKLFNRSLSNDEITAEYEAQLAGYTSGLSLGTIIPGFSNSVLSDIVVQTDAPGYTLAISQDHNLSDGTNTIPAISSGTIASPVVWSEGTTKGLGFSLSATNATPLAASWNAGNSYAVLPGTATTMYTRTGTQSSRDYVTMKLRADVPMSQPSSATPYTNLITLTGTMAP